MSDHQKLSYYQKIFVVLFLFFLIDGNALLSQGILTGNHSGQGIIFNPLTDIYILPEGPKATECYEMDFNQDGIFDLVFCATVWSRWDSINHTTEVFSAQNTTQMILYPPEPGWIYQLSANYWVDEDNNWTYFGILQYQRTTPYGYAFGGIFDEGYIGFRIPIGEEYLYGWVRVIASTIGIVLQKYAYQTILTSEQEYLTNDRVEIFPNPTTDKFVLSFADVKQDEYEISIFDMQGKKCGEVFNGHLQQGDHQIQLSAQELNIENGIYLVSVKSSTGQHIRKIVVH